MIDKDTQAALRERFNPEGSDLRNLQMHMLDMLDYFDEICRENGIKYWLSSGTTLGAVRHGGYIPWDDDIDVEMLREDYDKLVKVFKQMKDCPYDFQNMSTDPYYLYAFAKMRDKKSVVTEYWIDEKYKFKGIFIDILIIEKNNYFISKAMNRVLTDGLCELMKSNNSFKKSLFFASKRLYMFLLWFLRKINFCFVNKKYRYAYGSGFTQYTFDLDYIFPLTEIEFEGRTYFAPKDVDSYLTDMYGAYNELPNLDETPAHFTNFKFLDE